MSGRVVIVDGYNVIHRVPEFRSRLDDSLEQGREAILSYCANWMAERRDVAQFYLVFDGSSLAGGPMPDRVSSSLQVVFTRSKELADDRILDLVRAEHAPREVTVVSDDRYVSGSARALGAQIMSAAEFHSIRSRKRPRTSIGSGDTCAKTGLSPADIGRINADLLRELNIPKKDDEPKRR